jgi:hypothetical protein
MKGQIIAIASLALLTVGLCAGRAQAQIRVDGTYWKYQGQRTLLLGGWNHGHNPFIDHDTDNDRDNQGVSSPAQITAAMDELVAAGGNYLRCVLDPGMATGVQGFPFCKRAGERYDLNQMTGRFWQRLETFVAEAHKRNIVVQIELWDRFDLIDSSWGGWPVSPWNPRNNINYTAASSGLATSYRSFNTHPFLEGIPGHPQYEGASASRKQQYDVVREFQEKFVSRLLKTTLPYDNVLYCMNNETHADPAWGRYWMRFIEAKAGAQGKEVATTDMFDDVYRAAESRGLIHQLAHRDHYDYLDVSQANSRHRDEAHWEAVTWIVNAARQTDPPYLLHMTKVYGSDLALDGAPWSRWKPGDADNAIEEWWRNLLAGVAGVRFHRPTAGIGLSGAAKHCIAATRLVESKVKFWDLGPRLDLLSDRHPDEAYLGADPGQSYILYLTQQGKGSVKLDLRDYPGLVFDLSWVNVDRGDWGATQSLEGGSTVWIERPDSSSHWVAAIVKRKPGS